MEIHQIRYFLAVSESLNFTRAAEACHVSEPSLTRAVQKLEDELGGPLFRRERGDTGLTELGRLMKPYLEQTLGTVDAARHEAQRFKKLERAPLTLGVMCTIGPARLVPLVNRLATKVPGLELKLREGTGHSIVKSLQAGEVDVAIVGLPSYPDKVRAEPLYRERYVVAYPPGHRFDAMNAVRIADMEGEEYLARVNCEYEDFFKEETSQNWSVKLNVRYRSEREDWIQAMILAGMGCAFIPEYLPMFPAIRTRILIDPEISREISLVTARGRRFSPALDLLVRMAKTHDWNRVA